MMWHWSCNRATGNRKWGKSGVSYLSYNVSILGVHLGDGSQVTDHAEHLVHLRKEGDSYETCSALKCQVLPNLQHVVCPRRAEVRLLYRVFIVRSFSE